MKQVLSVKKRHASLISYKSPHTAHYHGMDISFSISTHKLKANQSPHASSRLFWLACFLPLQTCLLKTAEVFPAILLFSLLPTPIPRDSHGSLSFPNKPFFPPQSGLVRWFHRTLPCTSWCLSIHWRVLRALASYWVMFLSTKDFTGARCILALCQRVRSLDTATWATTIVSEPLEALITHT